MSDESKKPNERQEKIEDLNQKPITEKDAQSVKGGLGSIKLNAAKK